MAQLTKRGLVAAVVCSDTFMKLGTAQAKVQLFCTRYQTFSQARLLS